MGQIIGYTVFNGNVGIPYKYRVKDITDELMEYHMQLLLKKHNKDKKIHDPKYENDYKVVFKFRLSQQERSSGKYYS